MKSKIHTIYKTKTGDKVPGVTTVLSILSKPALIHWAWQMGIEGKDYTKIRDDKGEIGTLAHAMIMADLKGEEPDTSDYSKEQIDQAENCFLSWLEWRKGKVIEPLLIEKALVSELYQYGGTLDFYGMIDGISVLGDYKTGGIWKESYIQTCAYRQLLREDGYKPPEKILILGIPRTPDEKFQEVTYTEFDKGTALFLHLREAYSLLKDIK